MFDSGKQAEGLDSSTFDIVKIDAFHNTRFWTVISFLWVWIILIFKVAILAGDTYTCVSILVFNRWSTSDYDVYEYKVAKWIFTGCIFFRFLLLAYQIAWGIHVYRTRNIALAYLNNYARLMYAVRSYDYQCLFHDIDQEGFFEWACFHVYTELDNALEVLVADLPRQIINFMTLRYYATGGELNNDILGNIETIATTNLRLSIILSFQLCTMVLFLFFFFKFLLAILLYIPIKVKVAHKGFRSLKAYCYKSVNEHVRFLVKRNHKPRMQILNEGVMDIKEIQANPLLASTSTFDSNSWQGPVRGTDQGSFGVVQSNNDFFDRSSEAINLSHFTSKDSLNSSQVPPSYAYQMPGSRENPFAAFQSSDLVDEDSNNTDSNPFADSRSAFAHVPARMSPPVRSKTAESLLSRRMAGSTVTLGTDEIYDSDKRHYLTERGFLHVEDGTPMLGYGYGNTSASHLLYHEVQPARHSISQSSMRSGESSVVGNHTDLEYEGVPSRHIDMHDTSKINSSGSSHSEDDTPYPVRGVSQYFGESTDV